MRCIKVDQTPFNILGVQRQPQKRKLDHNETISIIDVDESAESDSSDSQSSDYQSDSSEVANTAERCLEELVNLD